MKKTRRGAYTGFITLFMVLSTLSVYGAGSPMMNVAGVDGSCPKNAERSVELSYGEQLEVAPSVWIEPMMIPPKKIGLYEQEETHYMRLNIVRKISLGSVQTMDKRARNIPFGSHIAEFGVLVYGCKKTSDGVVVGLKKSVLAEKIEQTMQMKRAAEESSKKYVPTWTYCAASRTICDLLARGWELNHLSPTLPPKKTTGVMGSPAVA